MTGEGKKIGVYICHCGGNIADYVDVEKVRAAVEKELGVTVAKTSLFTCSDASQQEMMKDIRERKLVVKLGSGAYCSTRTTVYTGFQTFNKPDVSR